MENDIKQKIIELVKSVMKIDISKMSLDTEFNKISYWDSFNNLMLISKLQDTFKIEFAAVEIEKTRRIKDLFSLIERKVK